MCRSRAHGGRRCPGDTSQARKARRIAQKTRGNQTGAGPRTTPPPDTDTGAGAGAPDDRPVTLADIRTRATTLNTHLQLHGTTYDTLEEAQQAINNTGDTEMFIPVNVIGDPSHVRIMVKYQVAEQRVREIGHTTNTWLDTQLETERARLDEENEELAGMTKRLEKLFQNQPGNNKEASRIWMQAFQELTQEIRDYDHTARDAYYAKKRELLRTLRDMGGTVEHTDLGIRTPKKINTIVQEAMSVFPTEWVEASNTSHTDDHPLRVRGTKTRAHYAHHNLSAGGKGTGVEYTITHPTPETARPGTLYVPLSDTQTLNELRVLTKVSRTKALYEGTDFCVAIRDTEKYAHQVTNGEEYVLYENERLTPEQARARGVYRSEYTGIDGKPVVSYLKPRMTGKGNFHHAELTVAYDPKKPDYETEALACATHEFSHRFEKLTPHVAALEKMFYERRTTNPEGFREKPVRYAKNEITRPDNFIDPYVGRDYGRESSYEIFSMGTEAALYGRHGGFGATNPQRVDDEHHDFVIGTLLTA